MLIDADGWGQVNLLDLLARYARRMLSKPSASVAPSDSEKEKDVSDPDLQLLLTSAEPLFMSQNPAVGSFPSPLPFCSIVHFCVSC